MLRLQGIVKRYGTHLALDGVDLEVPQGTVFGLLGPNGAGKTTLIRIITRITGPDAGTILFNGRPMGPDDVAHIGYLPEERGLYKKMKVGEQAVYLARLKGMPRPEAIRRLREHFERWEMMGWWNKKVEELSKGMAQKVQFVTTVLHGPQLLILDEPFSGFDPINAELVRTEILRMRDAGTTVMLSTHNMGSVEELCDHIALIHRAHKVLDGTVREIRKRFSTRTYRIEFQGSRVAFANALGFSGELVDLQEGGEYSVAHVKLGPGATPNDVLRQLIATIPVHGLQEEVPRMHDIFIQAVGEKVPGAVTAEMTE
ncbi:MAG: ATP-binding cassette domain-containing protein [Flavobacteriales bacterium]|nr:ATP-binding cassette domain-containing protein [Flavobacteriales bacterium]